MALAHRRSPDSDDPPELRDAARELDRMEVLTVRALVEAVDLGDADTRRGSRRVGAIVAAAARALGLGDPRRAAPAASPACSTTSGSSASPSASSRSRAR